MPDFKVSWLSIMAKVLKCVNQQACIGCGLCVLTSSRVLNNTFSFVDSCVRLTRPLKGKDLFAIKIDEGICQNMEEVVNICPKRCFAIVEESQIEK